MDPTVMFTSSEYVNRMTLQNVLLDKMKYYLKADSFNDPIFNMLTTMLIIQLTTVLLKYAESIPQLIKYVFTNFLQLITECTRSCHALVYRIIFGFKPKFYKSRIIEKITDDRQLNPLYYPIVWYLMNQINMDDEETLKLLTEEKIDGKSSKLPLLLKRLNNNREREFQYNTHDIKFKFGALDITIDNEDKQVTKRNDQIVISTYCITEKDDILDKFVQTCMHQFSKYMSDKIQTKGVYHNVSNDWSKIAEVIPRSVETIVMKHNHKSKLTELINFFMNDRKWYNDRSIPHKLGILLHGTPGCGKTSIIRYISHFTNRNTYYLRLNQISNENDFVALIKKIDLAKSVLVMEDIDCATDFVKDRDTLYKMSQQQSNPQSKPQQIIIMQGQPDKDDVNIRKPTLDTLLNILDGTLTIEGQIVIITTNFIEVLDKAIIRPGRMDIRLQLGKCDHTMIADLFRIFYNHAPNDAQYILIEKTSPHTLSPAEVMNVFLWNKDNEMDALNKLCVDKEIISDN
jgi:ATP-dependent 26S proteasome regulatory subunit